MTQRCGNRIFLMEEQLECWGAGAERRGTREGCQRGYQGGSTWHRVRSSSLRGINRGTSGCRAMSISENPALDGLSAGATTLLNPVAQEEGTGATNSARIPPVPVRAALAVGRTNPMPALGRRLPIPAVEQSHGSGSSGEASV